MSKISHRAGWEGCVRVVTELDGGWVRVLVVTELDRRGV